MAWSHPCPKPDSPSTELPYDMVIFMVWKLLILSSLQAAGISLMPTLLFHQNSYQPLGVETFPQCICREQWFLSAWLSKPCSPNLLS